MKIALLLFFASVQVFAKSSDILQKTLAKYSKASSIQIEIKKIDEKVILGTKSESTGVLKYQKDKIYISQENQKSGDKKIEIFYNNKVLTLVEYPDADFEKSGARKVTTLKKSIPPLVQSLLNLFSDPKNFNNDFELLDEKTEKTETVISFKSNLKNVKTLNLMINSKKQVINELSFTDDVDTKTTIQFNNLKLSSKLNKKDFLFVKRKTDEEMSE